MSKTAAWMPFYVADYLADTRRLNTTEHGAYLLLLMEQWRNGDLPDDDAELARITGMRIDHWKRSALKLRAFFDQGDRPGTLRQKRLHAEMEKARGISSKRAGAARERWANSSTAQGANSSTEGARDVSTTHEPNPLNFPENTDANAGGLKPFCTVQPQPHPQPEKKGEEATLPLGGLPAVPAKAPRAKPNREQEPEGFAEWYQAYPRHENRKGAAKAFPAACRKVGGPDRLMELLRKHRFSPEHKFIPYPATWLNEERWSDAPKPDPRPVPRRPNGPPPKYAWFRGGSTPAADDDFYPSEKPILDLASGDWR